MSALRPSAKTPDTAARPRRVRTAAPTRLSSPYPDLRGRGVLITGGASGIGRGLAVAFARAGARVTILDCDDTRGRSTLAELRELSRTAQFICADLRRDAQVRAAAAAFRGASGATILINNAATTGPVMPFTELKRAEFERVIRTNLAGPFLLSQLAAQSMIAAGRPGTIINIHTIQTSLPVPGYSAYIASKGAVDALTLALAVDLAPHQIRVNGVEVGSVLTESFEQAMADRMKGNGAIPRGEDMERLLDRRTATLLGRMGRSEEIARVALFLASDESSYLTGSIIRADGGRAISRKTEPLL